MLSQWLSAVPMTECCSNNWALSQWLRVVPATSFDHVNKENIMDYILKQIKLENLLKNYTLNELLQKIFCTARRMNDIASSFWCVRYGNKNSILYGHNKACTGFLYCSVTFVKEQFCNLSTGWVGSQRWGDCPGHRCPESVQCHRWQPRGYGQTAAEWSALWQGILSYRQARGYGQ